jgi:short-subunit dehydrogenase
MTKYWPTKHCLIVGGSSGLGFALARQLARAGARRISIVARDAGKLNDARSRLASEFAELEILAITADVTRDDDAPHVRAQHIERFGQLDLLASVVGQSTRGEAIATSAAMYRESLEVNFLSAVNMVHACAKDLIQSRGHIINIGSLASKAAGQFLGAYPPAKAALALYSQQLRMELEPKGVHTLLVCPGPLKRDDAGHRYDAQAENLPDAAKRPGGGVKLKGIDCDHLATMILTACERRHPELVVPWKARVLFAVSQMFPTLGDWLLRRMTGSS